MIIRQATPTDAPAMAGVHVRSWEWAYRGLIPDEILDRMAANLDRRIQTVAERLEHETSDHRTWVTERDGRIVGFACTGPSRDADADEHVGEIEAIYVAPEVGGTGIGRGLFGHATQDIWQRGYTRGILWVLDGNVRARRFYEAAGWRPDGATKVEDRAGFPLLRVHYCGLPPGGAAKTV